MNLKPITLETIDHLQSSTWFDRLGEPTIGNEPLSDQIKLVKNWQEAMRFCSGMNHKWENIQIQAANSFRFKLMEVDPKLIKTCNDTAGRVRPIALEIARVKAKDTAVKNNLSERFMLCVEWDLIHLLIEAEYSDLVKPTFFAAQAFFYCAGRFPCGWVGAFPQGKIMIY